MRKVDLSGKFTEADKVEYSLGQDSFSRDLKLIAERDRSGTVTWTIKRIASSQRDENCQVDNIPRAILERIAKIIIE